VIRTTAQVTLARDNRPEGAYRESLTIVEEQSARLSRLVDSMFLLSRAEAQGIPLIPEPLYLDELLEDCARAVRVVARARRVEVQTRGSTEVAYIGDNTLLRQMVGNLLDNAIRHAQDDGTVEMSLLRTPGGVSITVTDDGPGIRLEDRERIFQRFARLDQRSNGAGLGLPIARWIAEAHGGELILESAEPGRTCFRVTLPT
jgi:signal transduction histidine kinase